MLARLIARFPFRHGHYQASNEGDEREDGHPTIFLKPCCQGEPAGKRHTATSASFVDISLQWWSSGRRPCWCPRPEMLLQSRDRQEDACKKQAQKETFVSLVSDAAGNHLWKLVFSRMCYLQLYHGKITVHWKKSFLQQLYEPATMGSSKGYQNLTKILKARNESGVVC